MQLCPGSSTRVLRWHHKGKQRVPPQKGSFVLSSPFSGKDVGEFIAASSASSGLPHGWEAGLHGWQRKPLIATYTILGVPYYSYSIMGPKTLYNY